jgi:hypothetical protein
MVPGQPRRRGWREQIGLNRGVAVGVAMAHDPGRRPGRFAGRGSFAARRRFPWMLRAGIAATAPLHRAATADMLRRRRGRVPFRGAGREPHAADGEQVCGEREAGNKLSAGRSPGQDSSNAPHEGMRRSGERLLCGALYGHVAGPARVPLRSWLRSPELYPFAGTAQNSASAERLTPSTRWSCGSVRGRHRRGRSRSRRGRGTAARRPPGPPRGTRCPGPA